MNPRRLLHTSAIRLALRYALLHAVMLALGLAILYWLSSRFVDAQIEAGLQQELARLSHVDRQQGRERLLSLINASHPLGEGNQRYYMLRSSTGAVLGGNLLDWPGELLADGIVRNLWIEDDVIPGHMEDDDGFWPTVVGKLTDDSQLLVAQGVQQAEDLQEFFLSAMMIILGISVTLSLTMGWFLGHGILRRIDTVTATAAAIIDGKLSRRIPLSTRNDEFDDLARALNSMLTRIEQLLDGMRQVTDNVAHDLRQPLSRLRNRLEVTLLNARAEDEYRNAMQEAITDADHLIRTFNALLEIAQTEAGSFRGQWETVDITDLTQELGSLYQDLAEEQGKQLRLSVHPHLQVMGNRHLLAQAINNLLDNAIKYTPADGCITLQAQPLDGAPAISVSDNGCGIPASHYNYVLQRFQRLNDARSDEGNGLGLSLVKAAVELHKAHLILQDNAPGLRVTLRFAKPNNA